ncbi:endoglucanase [Betaproteobacteria bacterium]|nr:endoglucanase [Betaproteobacteria bacterium]
MRCFLIPTHIKNDPLSTSPCRARALSSARLRVSFFMRIGITLFALMLLFASSPGKADISAPPFKRVMNMGNALEVPPGQYWGIKIENAYFNIIKQAGFDAVRLPVRFSAYTGEAPDHILDPYFMAKVDDHVRHALSSGLVVILDLHHFDELMASPIERKRQFLSIWWQLSERYKDYSDQLIFEILNEPTGELQGDLWNDYLQEAVFMIRVNNPNRYLVISTDTMNHIAGLARLKIPQTHKLILSFHYYAPFEFTHQGQAFAGLQDKTGRTWGCTPAELQELQRDFQTVRDFASSHGLPVFLGEFGVNTMVSDQERALWTTAVRQQAEKLGFAWGYWEFGSGFSAYDLEKNAWRPEILNALVGARQSRKCQ